MNLTEQLSRIVDIYGKKPDGSLFTRDDVKILVDIDPQVKNYSRTQLDGLLIAKAKAEKLGCELKSFERIGSIPIIHEEKVPRQLIMREKPTPVTRQAPMYEDVKHASLLFTRERVLDEIAGMKQKAQDLGKDLSLLTTDDWPCDYFYDSFMTSHSVVRGDNVQYAYEKTMKEQKNRGRDTCVTIWAEGYKAFSRYARMGFSTVITVIPDDYARGKCDRFLSYARKAYPGTTFVIRDGPSEQDMVHLSSREFIEVCKLDPASYFICNYLPQFMHLRHGFSYFMCAYLDEEVIKGSEIVVLPDLPLSQSARLDFYSVWFVQNKPDIVAKGHGGIYDPVRRTRISFSQHGCFEDAVRCPLDFGIVDYEIHSITAISGVESSSQLKICLKSEINEEKSDSDEQYQIIENGESLDLSYLNVGTAAVYVPSVLLSEVQTDEWGSFKYNGVEYTDLPVKRTLWYSIVEEELKVVDVDYKRKSFFERRLLIPESLRIEYSQYCKWRRAYVVIPNSFGTVGQYTVNLDKVLECSRARLAGSVSEIRFNQVIIPGLGWNHFHRKLVHDPGLYMYASQFPSEFQSAQHQRFYEFSDQYAVRRAVKFQIEDYWFELPASRNEEFVSPDGAQFLFDYLGSSLSKALLLHFYDSFHMQTDDLDEILAAHCGEEEEGESSTLKIIDRKILDGLYDSPVQLVGEDGFLFTVKDPQNIEIQMNGTFWYQGHSYLHVYD